MRDPARIDGVLKEIKTFWELVPDWRFNQLMSNIQKMYGDDMFFVEDDVFVDFLKELISATLGGNTK